MVDPLSNGNEISYDVLLPICKQNLYDKVYNDLHLQPFWVRLPFSVMALETLAASVASLCHFSLLCELAPTSFYRYLNHPCVFHGTWLLASSALFWLPPLNVAYCTSLCREI